MWDQPKKAPGSRLERRITESHQAKGLVTGINCLFSAVSRFGAAVTANACSLSAFFPYKAALWTTSVKVLSLIS